MQAFQFIKKENEHQNITYQNHIDTILKNHSHVHCLYTLNYFFNFLSKLYSRVQWKELLVLQGFSRERTGPSSPVPQFLFPKEITFNSLPGIMSTYLNGNQVLPPPDVFSLGHCTLTFLYGRWGLGSLFFLSTPCTIHFHPHNIVIYWFWLEK